VLEEAHAGRFQLAADLQDVVFFALGRRPAPEDATADVHARKGGRVLRGQGASHWQEAGRVVRMVVAQDDVGHVREVDAHLARVAEDGLRPSSGIEKEPAAIDLDESREAPLADPAVGEHGREEDDAEGLDAWGIGCGLGPGEGGGQGEDSD